MDDKLAFLVSVFPPSRKLRRGLAEKLCGLPAEEIERQCIDALCQWLGVTCAVFLYSSPSHENPVKDLVRHSCFVLAILQLKPLMDTWVTSEPPRERLACLETVIELLIRVEAKKEQVCSAVENELIASYLLCYGLWSEPSGRPLIQGAEMFARNDLYSSLAAIDSLDDLVKEVRRLLFA